MPAGVMDAAFLLRMCTHRSYICSIVASTTCTPGVTGVGAGRGEFFFIVSNYIRAASLYLYSYTFFVLADIRPSMKSGSDNEY